MWTPTTTSGSHRLPDELANEFLKSKFNREIIDDSDLKEKVNIFLKGKELKVTMNNRLFEVLRYSRQLELRYSLDFC